MNIPESDIRKYIQNQGIKGPKYSDDILLEKWINFDVFETHLTISISIKYIGGLVPGTIHDFTISTSKEHYNDVMSEIKRNERNNKLNSIL